MTVQKFMLGVFKHLPPFIVRRMAGAPFEIDGNVLDANIQLVANQAANAETPTELAAMRAGIHESFKVLNGARRKNVAVRDSQFDGPAGALTMRLYEPVGAATPRPAILFFHQGGLVVMDVDTDDTFCTVLADVCQATVISLDYRLCPENAFPAAFDDALALWAHVQAQGADMGIDRQRVALAGDSAGALLSSVLCQIIRDRGDEISPAAQLLGYPWVTTQLAETGSVVSCAEAFPLTRNTMEFFNAMVFPDGKNIDHPYANPLTHENLADLPPAIIATAGFDPIRDQGNDYAARLKAAGNQVKHYCFSSLCHSFWSMGNVSRACDMACDQLARDLAALLQKADETH